jgi:hypothetical protein
MFWAMLCYFMGNGAKKKGELCNALEDMYSPPSTAEVKQE